MRFRLLISRCWMSWWALLARPEWRLQARIPAHMISDHARSQTKGDPAIEFKVKKHRNANIKKID
jgi:hypothetical protein